MRLRINTRVRKVGGRSSIAQNMPESYVLRACRVYHFISVSVSLFAWVQLDVYVSYVVDG